MDRDELEKRIAEFTQWHYRFEFDNGVTTSVPDSRLINRQQQRRRYFFDPLVQLCGGSLSGRRVLDLGCSAGFWSLQAIEAGADFVVGVDARSTAIDQANLVFEAKGIDPARYSFQQRDIFDGTSQERFDVVLCLSLISHLSKPVELFELMAGSGAEIIVIETELTRSADSVFALSSSIDGRKTLDHKLVLIPSRDAVDRTRPRVRLPDRAAGAEHHRLHRAERLPQASSAGVRLRKGSTAGHACCRGADDHAVVAECARSEASFARTSQLSARAGTMSDNGRPAAILCISQSFPPETTPTAIRAGKLLERLSAEWDVTVLSESPGPHTGERVRVDTVHSRRPKRLLAILRRLRMSKLLEMVVWPDESIFWVLPAILAGRRVIGEIKPSAIVVFMMPYSGGLTGIALSRLSGLPLILNLDDSPTCTDMHPHFPTRLHFRLARALEDFFVRRADAVVYVSQTNLDLVSSRQPEDARRKLRLVRYGADRADFRPQPPGSADLEIAYVGAMSGWWSLIDRHAPTSPLARAYNAWTRLGRYERTTLDQRTSSPAIIGQAILDVIAEHPDWSGRLKLMVYGNPYPASLVAESLCERRSRERGERLWACSARRGCRHHRPRRSPVPDAAQATRRVLRRAHICQDIRVPRYRPADPCRGAAG